MNAAMERFVDMVTKAVMVAAAELIREQQVDHDKLVAAMRKHTKAALPGMLEEGKVMVESGNSGWAQAVVATHCIDIARKAVEEARSG